MWLLFTIVKSFPGSCISACITLRFYSRITILRFMNTKSIRPIALCVFRKDNRILVAEGYDNHKSESFYRPLGGGVNFGEYSWETIRREIKEEIGEEIKNLTFIGPSENLFNYEGTPSHEIIFMFEGEFVNKETYRQDLIFGTESDGQSFKAVWKPISEFTKRKARLYPDGLLELLTGS